jgi:hypothetical protein
MICPSPSDRVAPSEDFADSVLREIFGKEITLRVITEAKEDDRWNKLIRQHHYLKEHRMVGESLRYVAEVDGEWIALLGWSSAAFHLHPRERWIGWTDGQRNARRHLVACNARFLLLHASRAIPNVASRVLAMNLRRLSDDWLEFYQHPILLAETFVDPERFEGTCYRASNWIEVGLTKGYKRSRLDFYQLHDHPKSIFLFPLLPEATSLLSAPILPAPWNGFERIPPPSSFPLSPTQSQSLLEALEQLPDPRVHGGKVHRRVASIVAIAVAGMIAGNNSLLAIGQFALSLSQRHLQDLKASRHRRTRRWIPPSESTIRRTLNRLDPEALDARVSEWLRSHLQAVNLSLLAVDGKCVRTASKIRRETITLFSGLDVQTRQVRRQIQVSSKSNEIPALKDLLADLDLRNVLVTADALHTQKETARFLVEQKQADYLVPVKANHPKLFKQLIRLSKTAAFFPSGHHSGSGPRPA